MDLPIDVKGIEETLSALRKLEPELLAKLRKDVKDEPALLGVMSDIRSAIPKVSPLQGNEFGYGGMNHNGRTSYKGATVKAQVTTSTSRLASKGFSRIVTISTAPPEGGIGFEILDTVGSGKRGNTARAEGMKKKLAGKASRYVWKNFESKQAAVASAIQSVIGKYSALVNVKLR